MITLCSIPGRAEAVVMERLRARFPQAGLSVRRGTHSSKVRIQLDESTVPQAQVATIAMEARTITGQ